MQKTKKLVSSRYISYFRLAFSVLMIPQIYNLVPHIHELENSCIVFHYPGLDFIEAYSHTFIDIVAGVSYLSVFLLGLGKFPRLGAMGFLITFSYLFLIDISFYNNHYYLWCLIAFLFLIVDQKNWLPIWKFHKKEDLAFQTDIKNYVVFGLLISIVYFYGGIAKINMDWLQGYPMRLMTSSKNYPYPDFLGYFFSYFGLIFDLSIAFLLWYIPKNKLLIFIVISFHLSNYFLFNIGEFPLVMLATWPLFLVISKFLKKHSFIEMIGPIKINSIRSITLFCFFTIQIIYPLRPIIFGKDVAWNRQGYNFTWRMMLNNYKPIYFQFLVSFENPNLNYHVDFSKLLTYRQFYHAYHDPYLIWLLSQKLKKDAVLKYEDKEVKIYCKSLFELNQHKPQELINSNIDLSVTKYNHFKKNNFVNNFNQDY
ncbi:HTTM domain-containing protein [Flavobacterium luminosum]|uniref:HTTM domain-containing protein n=1 Tax=Flavobacterium luminosum TaxID=2949086 RepID=A0ABT0TK15_9FLAO|nr:HTTM domain-containing protein [Flavobacterium sp. HXWNR70]MCL9807802.1 HTTM domain-containing protein [Flavobacterium sp. HXWNR70]